MNTKIPLIDSFQITDRSTRLPVEVEGGTRFVHERDVIKLLEIARDACSVHDELVAALQAVAPYFEGEHAYDHPHCVQLRAALAKVKP